VKTVFQNPNLERWWALPKMSVKMVELEDLSSVDPRNLFVKKD
jgi:hypothetical protein